MEYYEELTYALKQLSVVQSFYHAGRLEAYKENCGSSIDCDTVSGYMSLGCAACPADVDFDSVSGSLTLTLPAGSQYTLAFDSVSGRIITTNFTPGTAAPCAISAETVSGDLEIRNP